MEGTGFITPIQLWEIGTREYGEVQNATAGTDVSLFKNVFKNAVDQVRETEADVEHKQYLLSTGQLDDAHTLPIAEAKAALSLDVLITLRNKTLEAYNELIKMNV